MRAGLSLFRKEKAVVRTTSNACAMRLCALAGTLLGLSGLAGPALVRAGVVTNPFTTVFLAGGQAVEVGAPASVAPGKLTSSETIKVFKERDKFTLQTPILVDIIGAGKIDRPKDLSFGKVQPGTKVNIYFIHGDAGEDAPATPIVGTVEFAQPILGVMISEAAMSRSDNAIGGPDTEYPMTELRGLELEEGDWLEISGDRKTIRFAMNLKGSIDQMRVITLADEDDTPTGMSGGGGGLTFGGGMGDGTGGGGGRPPVGGDVPLMDDGGGGSSMPVALPDTGSSSASVPEVPNQLPPPSDPPPPKDSTPDNPNPPPDHPHEPPTTPAPGGLMVMGLGLAGGLRRRRA